MPLPEAYRELLELSKQIHTYDSVISLLHWDQETYLPSGAITPRSEQIALLSAHVHDLKTSRKYKQCLKKLLHFSSGKPKVRGLSHGHRVCLREWHRDFLRQDKLPTSFVKTFSQVTSEASQIWSAAKKANNFKLFAPFLSKIIELSREKAKIWGFEEHPYDALLESYEPCMTTGRVTTIFEGLRKHLVALLQEIRAAKPIDDKFLRAKIDESTQIAIGKAFLDKLPIDSAYSRLDLSAHPFSTAMHPHDSRITTRILPNSFMSNLFSIFHEAGHSMYEMGLPVEHWGTPLSEAVSLSIHESQSRWWETLIGRSHPFWKTFYPFLQKQLPSQLKKVPLEKFYRAINRVEPSLIRVEADEVTYCLHVILRFEIEKELIQGTLQVNDLPDAWRAKMKELLGVIPKTDAEGCLQDIHWSLGDFGYFPTYALGNLFSAQFFTTFAKDHSDWDKRIEKGDLSFIREWLKTHIHCWGRTYNSDELVKKVTGKPLSEAAYCSYLKKKYTEIYRLR
jgi:carboxypeptidase Taq